MRALGLTVIALLAGVGLARAAPERYADTVDVASQIKPVLTAQGIADPAFYEAIGHPSPILRDFFGIQVLADMTRDKILADFVPGFASLSGEDDHSITLRFKRGYDVRFIPQSRLELLGFDLPHDHAFVSGATWRERVNHLDDFRTILMRPEFRNRYTLANPMYAKELLVARMTPGRGSTKVVVDPGLAQFDGVADAVLLAPEGVHGKSRDAERLMELLKAHRFDWLGLEMLTRDMQPMLDAFSRGKVEDASYSDARARLIAYFAGAWNGRAGPKTTGEENYYFKLCDTARQAGVRLIALEDSSIDYLLFGFGETPFGGAVRSSQWADAAPRTGRGIVFGGSAHFDARNAPPVQDFLHELSPARLIVTLPAPAADAR